MSIRLATAVNNNRNNLRANNRARPMRTAPWVDRQQHTPGHRKPASVDAGFVPGRSLPGLDGRSNTSHP